MPILSLKLSVEFVRTVRQLLSKTMLTHSIYRLRIEKLGYIFSCRHLRKRRLPDNHDSVVGSMQAIRMETQHYLCLVRSRNQRRNVGLHVARSLARGPHSSQTARIRESAATSLRAVAAAPQATSSRVPRLYSLSRFIYIFQRLRPTTPHHVFSAITFFHIADTSFTRSNLTFHRVYAASTSTRFVQIGRPVLLNPSHLRISCLKQEGHWPIRSLGRAGHACPAANVDCEGFRLRVFPSAIF